MKRDKTPTTERPATDGREALRQQIHRNGIDAAHFLGLAHLYSERGEHARALECLEVAGSKQPSDPAVWKLRGRILARRKDFEPALQALRKALRFNPFDRETAEILDRTAYECQRFEDALEGAVHAFLLLQEGDEPGAERLRRRIQTHKQILGWGNRELSQVFRERQEALEIAFDRLQWHRERFFQDTPLGLRGPVTPSLAPRAGQIELAARLRPLEVWNRLTDEQIFRLSGVFRLEPCETGAEIFSHGSAGRELYVLEAGQVLIQRPTSYGTIHLAALAPGNLFGEVNFIDGGSRSGEALAARPGRLLVADADALERLIDQDPELGLEVYWTFWRSLSAKLRGTTEQLQRFFAPEARSENFLSLRRRGAPPPALLDPGQVDQADKIRLFREQGLSRRELMTLATFSREQRFPAGGSIFQDGDESREIYVVQEGRVLISKFIPGGGEEALAILERGDFFGEMALIDGAPRSASARAHGGPATVLSLDDGTVRELLSMDAEASLEFLRLLCRLVTRRLREIDDKVIGWRIMSGEVSGLSLPA